MKRAFLLLNLYVFLECLGSAIGLTLPPPRSVDDLVDLDRCVLKGMRSHVCDPDGIIPKEQAYQLDDLIRSIYNDTLCPCLPKICHRGGQGGYLVGIAIVRAMKLDLSIRRLNYTQEDQPKYMDAVLNEAKHFAYMLLQQWKMGRCGEDILIFFSEQDRIIYTVTHPEARKKLADSIVAETAMNTHIRFSHRETIVDGFKEILHNYRLALLEIDKRKKEPEMDPVLGHTPVFSGSSTYISSHLSAFTLFLLSIAYWRSVVAYRWQSV